MTPQERRRVADLFERLSRLENTPRDREAEQLIAEGLHYVPNAPYALIQTVLLQEEALKRANERIAELEGADGAEVGQPGGGFLDSLREAFSGQPATPRRGSVPSTGGRPMGVPPGFRQGAAPAADQQLGRGGGFLGQAASIAAGVVVGSMVADALRGQFGSDAGQSSAAQQQAATEQDTQQQADADTDAYEGDGGEYDTADAGGDFGDFGGDFG